MRKYLTPILTVIIGSLLVQLSIDYLKFDGVGTFIVILKACIYFAFGVTLCIIKHGKQYTWIKKVIIAFVFFFVLAWQLGYVVFPQLTAFFNFLGLTDFGFSLVYIYLGWAFFD